MRERIEINGFEIDLMADSCLSFEVSSNLLKKVDDMSTGYSYTYDIPNTLRNRKVLGDLLTIGRSSNKVRQYLPASYYRNGLVIFEGNCYVCQVTENAISIYFQFGLNRALQSIKDDGVMLSSLWNDEDNDFVSTKGTTGIDAIEDLCVVYPCTTADWLKYDDKGTSPIAPVIPLFNTIANDDISVSEGRTLHSLDVNNAILAQITKRYGLTFEGLPDVGNYLQYKPAYKRYTSFSLHSTGYEIKHEYSPIPGTNPIDCISSQLSQATTTVTCDNDYEIRKDGTLYDFSWWSDGNIHAKSEYEIDEMTLSFSASVSGVLFFSCAAGYVEHQLGTYTAGDAFTMTFNPKSNGWAYVVAVGSYPRLFLQTGTIEETATVSMEISVKAHFNGTENSTHEGLYNLFDTLPDTPVTQFLTDYAFTAFGRYPVNELRGGDSIKFVNLEEMLTNKSVDWSDKLLTDDLSVYSSIDGTARNNWLCWKEDESEILYDSDHAFDVDLQTSDTTLEKETNFFENEFSYAIPHSEKNVAWFIVYREDEDQNPAPRLMRISDTLALSHDGVNYAQSVQCDNYIRQSGNSALNTQLAEVLKKPLRVECRVKLSALELSVLDLTKSVYLRQFGAHFFIDKLTVDDDTAKAVLIKLK